MSESVAAWPSFMTVVSSLILSFLLEFASVSSFAAWSNFSTVPVSCWLVSFIALELDPIEPELVEPVALEPVALEPALSLSLSVSVVVVVRRSVVVVVELDPDPIRSLDVPLDAPLCAVAG